MQGNMLHMEKGDVHTRVEVTGRHASKGERVNMQQGGGIRKSAKGGKEGRREAE